MEPHQICEPELGDRGRETQGLRHLGLDNGRDHSVTQHLGDGPRVNGVVNQRMPDKRRMSSAVSFRPQACYLNNLALCPDHMPHRLDRRDRGARSTPRRLRVLNRFAGSHIRPVRRVASGGPLNRCVRITREARGGARPPTRKLGHLQCGFGSETARRDGAPTFRAPDHHIERQPIGARRS